MYTLLPYSINTKSSDLTGKFVYVFPWTYTLLLYNFTKRNLKKIGSWTKNMFALQIRPVFVFLISWNCWLIHVFNFLWSIIHKEACLRLICGRHWSYHGQQWPWMRQQTWKVISSVGGLFESDLDQANGTFLDFLFTNDPVNVSVACADSPLLKLDRHNRAYEIKIAFTALGLKRRSKATRGSFFGYVNLKNKRASYPSVMDF
jgi:hypothetical protein